MIDGWRYFGYAPAEGETHADMARRHTEVFLQVLEGKGFAQPNPRPMFPNPPGLLRVEPHSERAARADLVGLQLECHIEVGRETGNVPSELDPQGR